MAYKLIKMAAKEQLRPAIEEDPMQFMMDLLELRVQELERVVENRLPRGDFEKAVKGYRGGISVLGASGRDISRFYIRGAIVIQQYLFETL